MSLDGPGGTESEASGPIRIESVTVGPERIEAVVCVSDPSAMRTSAVSGLAEEAMRLLPDLKRHRCECGSARGMVAELRDTETPHLLEHVALELMALSGSPRTLRGETVWDFKRDGRGVFRVSLDYDDDLVALAAIKEGVGIVEALIAGNDGVDIEESVERLREVRGR